MADNWIIENDGAGQRQLGVISRCAGAALLLGGWTHAPLDANGVAALLLGVLLLALGWGGVRYAGPQRIVISPAERSILVDERDFRGQRQQRIGFDDIAEVSVSFIGKPSSFMKAYYLSLHLKDGRRYPLFAPGRAYPGCNDRETVVGWQQRLMAMLGR